MDMAKLCNLFIRISIHDLGSMAVMAKERYIGHGSNDVWCKSCRGNGDASALRAACHSDLGRVHIRVAACRFNGADRIREDAAIVVMLWIQDSFGHAARE